MKKSRSTIWILAIAAIVVGIFLYARYQNERYATALESSIASSTSDALSVYTDATYGFSVSYPPGLIATSTFTSSYLLPAYWNIYAPEGSGDQVVAIEYPGSNDVLSSELRIGVSDDPTQVMACDKFPQGVTVSTHSINGVGFYVGTEQDDAMSHFSHTISYRAVRHNMCFALDLVSFGTNPEVYSPPRSVPFVQNTAEAELEQVVESFTFTK